MTNDILELMKERKKYKHRNVIRHRELKRNKNKNIMLLRKKKTINKQSDEKAWQEIHEQAMKEPKSLP